MEIGYVNAAAVAAMTSVSVKDRTGPRGDITKANVSAGTAGASANASMYRRDRMPSNVRDQRRRAVGAPLADRILSGPILVPASGVPTRDDRCIA